MPSTQTAWDTDDELAFIESLGAHSRRSWAGHDIWRGAHMMLLDGYRAGIARRVDWSGLDRERILHAIE